MDNKRHEADSARDYSHYFNLLEAKIHQYKIELEYMYNMDEKGFMRAIGDDVNVLMPATEEEAFST